MNTAPFLVVLGIAQDAGYPSAGCNQGCCSPAWKDPSLRRHAACLAIVDPQSGQRWMLDCTPDFREQLNALDSISGPTLNHGLDGIFLTHAHIGHYTGLMHLGREVLNTTSTPVHVMPKMRTFLESNAPWNQLVSLGNIKLHSMSEAKAIQLGKQVSLTPFLVPHRGEYSETVGFKIEGSGHSAIYIPDIDSWETLDTNISDLINSVDRAYLDGTFYSAEELPGRNMATIPHPTITSSLELLASLPEKQNSKVRFIHFNHTNPVLNANSAAAEAVKSAGLGLAYEGERFEL